MNNSLHKRGLPSFRLHQTGLSMVELLVAVVIGLFLTLGLSQMFLSMYSTSASQNTLAQYQDNQRIAIVMLTNTVELAGYYYNPTAQTAVVALPVPATANADTSTFVAGVGLTGYGSGTGATIATSDSINVYYQSSGSDNLYNCQGGVAAAGTPTSFINSFSLNSSGQLQCTVTSIAGGVVTGPSSALILATGIKNMNILYGVDLTGAGTTSSYLSANALTLAGLWSKVRTAQITINFLDANVVNPAVALTTATPWIQTINLMHAS